jgi:WD40 repeat protein
LAYSSDGKSLAWTDDKKAIRLWDLELDKQIAELEGHKSVRAVAFSPDGKWLASGGGFRDNTVRLWDLSELRSKSPGEAR